MSKIATAEEFAESNQYYLEWYDESGYLGINTKLFAEKLKEFAKLHVKAALEAASYNAEITWDALPVIGDFQIIDKDSILTAYPLENIK